jgi:trans-2,3-dihydro-3-hydroxyanthranilate isomerase
MAHAPTISYETVDVFTDTACGGNPLAVCFVPESVELSAAQMLKITSEFNYSESTFVFPPTDPAHTARVRIFTPATEVPFAGHPNVGTAAVLARRGECFGTPVGDEVIFEEEAGLVPVKVERGENGAVGATLTAPQSFVTAGTLAAAEVAAAVGLTGADIRTDHHAPTVASVGLPFIVTELSSREALERSHNVVSEFSNGSEQLEEVGKILCYIRCADADDKVDIRARMFTKRGNEDPATGSANCALVGLLASLDASMAETMETLQLKIAQGVEMGRPSL